MEVKQQAMLNLKAIQVAAVGKVTCSLCDSVHWNPSNAWSLTKHKCVAINRQIV